MKGLLGLKSHETYDKLLVFPFKLPHIFPEKQMESLTVVKGLITFCCIKCSLLTLSVPILREIQKQKHMHCLIFINKFIYCL